MEHEQFRNIGIRIAYDGSAYQGWQSQPNVLTVESALKKALYHIEGREIGVIGASRTDSGVHANGQFVNFYSYRLSISPEKYLLALNRYLSHTIRVQNCYLLKQNFHARYDALRRTYLYKINVQQRATPFESKYIHRIKNIPALIHLNRCLGALIGYHNFSAFAQVDEQRSNPHRTVYCAAAFLVKNYVYIKITANAFLRKMIRSIVGTLLSIPNCSAAYIEKMLHTQDRALAGETVSPCGLYLDWIEYGRQLSEQ